MKYITYLKNKNLSQETIRVYSIYTRKWIEYLNGKNPTKTLFVKYINKLKQNHKPNSVKLQYACILSYLKFQKKWKLYISFQDIKLPEQQFSNKEIISISDFNYLKQNIKLDNWIEKRNWLMFAILFTTGIRVNELRKIKIKAIVNKKVEIKCKGSLYRRVLIPDYLDSLLKNWKRNNICSSRKNKEISNNQIIKIIKNIGIKYLNISITPHSLRRSYATNLLRKGIDLKTVSKLMGHKSINTTSKYIYLTEKEIFDKVKNIFD